MIQVNSNRLFSSFLATEELNNVKHISYFPLLQKGDELTLLPSDHCYYYPLVFDFKTKEIKHGELNFFNTVLFENFNPSNSIPVDKYTLTKKTKQHKSCLVVNLIDNCYGHSFLKLLNLIEIYNQYHTNFDIWVICPKPLNHFVPDDKFYTVSVKLGFEEAKKCPSLQPLIDEIKKEYAAFDYVTLDTYASYTNQKDINDFFGFLPAKKTLTKKYITFYYRSDYFRSWAGRKQQKRITGFFKYIKPYFPECEMVVAGDKDDLKFPAWVNDIRTNAFGMDVDLNYNNYFNNSHIVIGLIGSNMLQPSMTCDFTIHLVPRPKVTIVAEEIFNHQIYSMPGWFKNIYLFGNEDLSDLAPEKLGEQTIILYLTFIAKKYKEEAYSDNNFKTRLSQHEFYRTHYRFFDYNKATELKKQITDTAFKKNMLKFRISKVLKKIGLN